MRKLALIAILLPLAGCGDADFIQANDWPNAEAICKDHGGASKAWRLKSFFGRKKLKALCNNGAIFRVTPAGWETPDE